MSRKILGLDIREKSLSAVLINGTLQGNQIEAFEYIDLSDNLPDISNDEKPDVEETVPENTPVSPEELLSGMLLRVAEKMVITGATCVVSLPAFLTSFRNLQVPFRNEKKIKQVIHFELEPVMPGSVDDLVVDFKLLEPPQEDGESILVTASVERSLLDSFESCLQKNGFDAQAVLPGGSAAAEYIIKSSESTDCLFIDADEGICSLFIIRDRQIVFIRSFGVRENDITLLGLDIKRTILSYCEQYDVDYEPSKVFAAGPLFLNRDFAKELSDKSGLNVELTDFCETTGFLIDDDIKKTWDPTLYDNALALSYNAMFGLSGLRFSERFFAVGKYFNEYKTQIVNAGILVLLVFVAGLCNMGLSAYATNKKITAARAEMVAVYKAAFPDAKVINNPYAQMKGKIIEARKNAAFQDKSSGNIRVIDMLNDVSKSLSDELDIEFSRFVLGSEDLKISGESATYSNVDTMKKELEKISYFKKVIISSTTNNKTGQGIRFKLKVEF